MRLCKELLAQPFSTNARSARWSGGLIFRNYERENQIADRCRPSAEASISRGAKRDCTELFLIFSHTQQGYRRSRPWADGPASIARMGVEYCGSCARMGNSQSQVNKIIGEIQTKLNSQISKLVTLSGFYM